MNRDDDDEQQHDDEHDENSVRARGSTWARARGRRNVDERLQRHSAERASAVLQPLRRVWDEHARTWFCGTRIRPEDQAMYLRRGCSRRKGNEGNQR